MLTMLAASSANPLQWPKEGLLGRKECCREALKDFAGDARSSPPAESGFASQETRRDCIKITTYSTITYRSYNQILFIRS